MDRERPGDNNKLNGVESPRQPPQVKLHCCFVRLLAGCQSTGGFAVGCINVEWCGILPFGSVVQFSMRGLGYSSNDLVAFA